MASGVTEKADGFRQDPRWQAAQEQLLAPLGERTADKAFIQRLDAAARMRDIEDEWEK